ncbi:MAG: ABC transporter substrate-binding protein, partial [Proteobacteria bacterium]|nr:ABC transporter substrate-binding protein [Pseudomonadota bacterium]MBU1708492.1 ABC transporter substrate-binding protein [Pseudomonadota bacterium]
MKIGITLGLTGKFAQESDMIRKGLSLWADKTNSENGLLGRKINLIMLDDQSNPQTAKELYRKLITEEKV